MNQTTETKQASNANQSLSITTKQLRQSNSVTAADVVQLGWLQVVNSGKLQVADQAEPPEDASTARQPCTMAKKTTDQSDNIFIY